MQEKAKRIILDVAPDSLELRLRNVARLSRKVMGRVAYRGSRVQCLCCGWKGRAFLSYKGRPDASCPNCGSFERHRFMWLFMKDHADLFPLHSRVLHVAPEPILQKRLKDIAQENYLSADLNRSDVDVRMDLTQIPFPDDSFDLVVCNHVLEHVPDDGKAIAEIARVMRPTGHALIQVPIYDLPAGQTLEDPSIVTPADKQRVYGQYDHLRKYGRDFKNRLESVGMKVAVVSPRDVPEASRATFCIESKDDANREDVFLCSLA